MTSEEKEKVVYKFNDTAVDFSGAETYVELFLEQVAKSPQSIAVEFESKTLTYAELDIRSNQLANYLLSKGVASETLIGICLERSLEMIIGILGILKAGCAYVPIDPEYPSERIQYMIQDSGIRIVLSSKEGVIRLKDHDLTDNELNIILLDSEWHEILTARESPAVTIKPHDLAYVIYTSGSTGKPKGVMNEHAGLVNRLKWTQSHFNLTEDDAVLQKTTFCFDVSVWELLWPVITGAKLVFAIPGGQKNSSYLEEVINDKKITTIHFVPSMLEIFLLDLPQDACKDLKRVLCSGEALTSGQVALFQQKLAHTELFNLYGPTEAAIDVSCWTVPRNPDKILIGKPVANTSLYILDEAMNPVGINETGELYIGGIQVARGYLNRPDLNKSSFLSNPFIPAENSRLYRTGDYARWQDDGNIEYLGRIDGQVKIRGFRIELGEIESAIQGFPGVKQSVINAWEDPTGEKNLIGYIVTASDGYDKHKLIEELKSKLPEYMVPALFIDIDQIPLNSNGKADRKALPPPEIKRPELSVLYKAPASETEKLIAKLWSSILMIDKAGIDDNFFELGGNSLRAIRFVAVLNQKHNLKLPVTRLYQHPTIGALASSIEGKSQPKVQHERPNPSQGGDIAVIGMSGRFPGANSVQDLWELLKDGKEGTHFFTDAELDPHIPQYLRNDPDYVKARGIIEDADKFDALFFKMAPRMAEVMDPQQRIFLEIAWEALEDTGYLPDKYDGTVGVFAGSGTNTYYINNVLQRPDLMEKAGYFQVSTVNEKDYMSTRTAYALNLRGPAVSVYSACSTSLLAIAQAVESLRKGQCNVALAGAVSITSPVASGHLYEEGAMLSRDGHTRSFDSNATGTVFSDGAGVVLLKNKEDAERDGDTIYAIIKGIGLNNDGAGKASFTAPDADGQAGAINMAIGDAGIDPSTISYVEAHGTATPLGDPIEIEGLKIAFGQQDKKQYCAIGSIKSNIGHLTQAAGVAGLIKTALSLYNQKLLPSILFDKPNADIDFDNSPFFVNSVYRDWESETVRRAGVSSFGVGGTNIHLILEEYTGSKKSSTPSTEPQLIAWSAKTETSLNNYSKKLSDYLLQNKNINLADIAYTLQSTRQDFNIRKFIIAQDLDDLITKLEPGSKGVSDVNTLKESAPEVVFVFPGQGSQYVNMGAGLYEKEPVFKAAVDECAALLNPHLKEDIRQVIFSDNTDEAGKKINNTFYTQPALFVIEYATAKLWMSLGIIPAALTGHSIGEFVAAHLSGVFSLEDALKLVSNRSRLISGLPGGSMLAVRSEVSAIEPLIPEKLSLAAINSPKLSVVSGTKEDIESFANLMTEKGIAHILLNTSHAFHSPMMDEIKEDFRLIVESVKLNPPRIPIVSTVSGKWMSEAEAMDPEYWINQLRVPVRFSDAINTLLQDGNRILLEVGPGSVTSTLARQHPSERPFTALYSFENKEDKQSEYLSILKTAGQLWQNGVSLNWISLNEESGGIRIKLPNYAFDKKRYWADPPFQSQRVQAEIILPDENIKITEKPEPVLQIQTPMRRDVLLEKVKEILEDASGVEMKDVTSDMNFIEMGLDSLLLTQVAITLKKEFALPITFRQLNESLGNLDLLTDFLDSNLPSEAYQTAVPASVPNINLAPLPSATSGNLSFDAILQQLHALTSQVATMQGGNNPVPSKPSEIIKPALSLNLTPEEEAEVKKPFGASPRIEKQASELNESQASFLNDLIKRYNQKTKKSKEYTQKHRSHMADPRVVSGFKPLTKEITYPIVAKKSKGCRIWDIDDNEYIDALNGFGSSMLGYQPDFIKKALYDQIEKGYEIGPQHELAGEVCDLVCEFTKFDRAAICSTGSEAVMGTMRIARTVTGRSLIVAFSGSYHGIFDEVVIRGTKKFRSLPAAPGIMPEAVQNMLILDYGTDESLKIIKERAHELAAVLVEPVQSRRPDFQPIEFLKEVRKITEESGTALIFDEIITGFRMHPGGAQALFDIKADIGSYGKVVGGGIAIGIIAGKKAFMDALDGGSWQFGDNSTPEVGVTYFAGTFVRHPLALATAKASLEYFKSRGPSLQESLTAKCQYLTKKLQETCDNLQLPFSIVTFGSLWRVKFNEDVIYHELLFTLMREKGIHILDGFPCFITDAHTETELDAIASAFEESAKGLIASKFLLPKVENSSIFVKSDIEDKPPVAGARLGRDKNGNPAWFIEDPKQLGKYMQVGNSNIN
jgi:amino acid adenylation domain-containing protein